MAMKTGRKTGVGLLIAALGVLSLGTVRPAGSPGLAQGRSMEKLGVQRGLWRRGVRDSIRGRESVIYRFGASAGQRLSVTLRTNNPSAAFNISRRFGGPALFNGAVEGNRARLILPESGDYFVEVYLNRNAGRRGERADYALTLAIAGLPDLGILPPRPRPPLPEPIDPGYGDPDYADGLTGGPDYWRVAGVPAGDALNIRSRPSASATAIARAPNGVRLRNLGCRASGATRWCRVELRDGSIGWANGRFLRE